ncbi:MAG: hypothetical protein NVSMB23_17350 [Myxococcales bacterium]
MDLPRLHPAAIAAALLGLTFACGKEPSPVGHSREGGPPVVLPGVLAGVGRDGGAVDRLWFAVTGDTRPSTCDASDLYPRAAIAEIAASMRALHVQFALDLGDHMYVCNGSSAEATQQMGFYTAAIAGGPDTFFLTLGNHDCGSSFARFGAGKGCLEGSEDANFRAYLAALGRTLPYYAIDVDTAAGLARFVFVADDAWDAAQAAWLERTLAEADARARYTVIARHHPLTGPRQGDPAIVQAIERHRATLLLAAHLHTYAHGADHGGRAVILGLGGAPSSSPPGFATVLQNTDGSLTFTPRDARGAPIRSAWTVDPQ